MVLLWLIRGLLFEEVGRREREELGVHRRGYVCWDRSGKGEGSFGKGRSGKFVVVVITIGLNWDVVCFVGFGLFLDLLFLYFYII